MSYLIIYNPSILSKVHAVSKIKYNYFFTMQGFIEDPLIKILVYLYDEQCILTYILH